MCVNNLSKVTLDSAAAGIQPMTSSRKSNALTTAPPSHLAEFHMMWLSQEIFFEFVCFSISSSPVFSCTVYIVTSGQVIDCQYLLRNDPYCVRCGIVLLNSLAVSFCRHFEVPGRLSDNGITRRRWQWLWPRWLLSKWLASCSVLQ